MNRLWLLLPVCLCVCLTPALADTTWVAAGEVAGEWTAEHSPYIVQGNLTVPASLAVTAGVEVYFTGPYRLTVTGALRVTGGDGAEAVRFTTDTLANPAGWRGILVNHATDTCWITDAIIEHSRWGTDVVSAGAGLRVQHSMAVCERTLFQYHHGFRGSAVYAVDSAVVHLTDCDLLSNTIPAFSGGAAGGALALQEAARAELTNCTFKRNEALDGGAMAIENGTTLIARDCRFEENLARVWGGAFYCSWAWIDLRGCEFVNNTGQTGGAIHDFGSTWFSLDHCLFAGNGPAELTNGTGGALLTDTDGALIRHCTFVGNRGTQGAAINTSAASNLNSCLFADHDTDVAVRNSRPEPTATATYCDFFENAEGNHNLAATDHLLAVDPLFVDLAGGDYHLTAASPLIDAGDPMLPVDPDGTRADIGAFYYPQPQTGHDPAAPLPAKLDLLAAFPNPFNPATTLAFTLPQAGVVSLVIFDILGRPVTTLVAEPRAAGAHTVRFDAAPLPSGTYFARLESQGATRIQKLLLLK